MEEQKLLLLKNLTLLLVDDDEFLLKNMKTTLSLFFDTIITATNGAEALKLHEEHQIDMLISDYVMPIMDGHKLAQKMRQIDENIPIIIVSNHSDKEKLLSVIPLNLTSYLLKPINFDELTRALIEVVDRINNQKIFEHKFSDEIVYNKLSKDLMKDETVIKLSKSEIVLIELFIKNKNQVVTQDMISYALDDIEPVSYHGIKNLIYRLRQKIGKDVIANIKSIGFIYHNK